MAQSNPTDPGASAPKQIIEQVMLRVHRLRQQYILAAQQNQERDPELHQNLHAAVISYYFALRPYRREDVISKKWDDAKLWKQSNGEWVRGFDALSGWVAHKTTAERESSKHGVGSETVETTQQLEPQILLRVSSALDDLANDLGIAVDVDHASRPAGELPLQTAEDPDDE